MTDAVRRYPNVFRPITLGPVALRNRIFIPAHTTNFGEDNLPSDRHLAYHRARAAGGAAMIVFEGIRVHRSSLGRRQGVNGYGAGAVPAFARIAREVQAEGARLFGQIIHLGRHIDGAYARMSAWGASPIPWTASAPAPHPMTGAEIAEVVAAHAIVARNLVEAGLDGIELQMAHGHLIQQFLSPASNARADGYGGTEEGRMRLARETLAAVREAVGDRAALGVRISADEFLEGGLALADMQRILPELLRDVPVDFVNVSHSAYHGSRTISTQMADMAFAADAFHHLPRGIAEALRAAGNQVPVFAVCGFRTIAAAEAMLADPRIAMIGMARAHIADPALVRKAAEGREEETRPCIACNQGCAGFLAQSLAITCLTNPAAGREANWSPPGARVPRVAAPRRVLVVGGGPAGLEAAAVAAARGHGVALWEASDRLGGALLWTERMPLRREFLRLIEAQRAALARTGVRIETERYADAASIAASGADAVLLATGAEPAAARFPGGGEGLTLEQALAAPDALGERVAVVDALGSWAVGAVVEFLAVLGKRVTVIAPTGQTGWHITIYSSFAWRYRLRQAGVRILGFRAVQAYRDGTAILTDLTTGAMETEPFDSIVAPVHGVPRDSLAETGRTAFAGRNEAVPIRLIGDCISARTALEAVFEGHEAGREI